MCDDHGDPFIATLHNVPLAPDLCDRLFSMITLINSVHDLLQSELVRLRARVDLRIFAQMFFLRAPLNIFF